MPFTTLIVWLPNLPLEGNSFFSQRKLTSPCNSGLPIFTMQLIVCKMLMLKHLKRILFLFSHRVYSLVKTTLSSHLTPQLPMISPLIMLSHTSLMRKLVKASLALHMQTLLWLPQTSPVTYVSKRDLTEVIVPVPTLLQLLDLQILPPLLLPTCLHFRIQGVLCTIQGSMLKNLDSCVNCVLRYSDSLFHIMSVLHLISL